MLKRLFLLLILAALALSISPARAQTGGSYELSWLTIDGGGATLGGGAASGGAYQSQATIGQPDAAGQASGGAYTLKSGFWVQSNYNLHLPVIMR
jgi:hypothetical protein